MVQEIVDKYLLEREKLGLNISIGKIPGEMVGDSKTFSGGYSAWKPIKSNIRDEDIVAFETLIGYRLPLSFIVFLKHKHFLELEIESCWFVPNPSVNWSKPLYDLIINDYPKEYLLDQGYLPFAYWQDWGLLCFDITGGLVDGEYPVVLWDHERPENIKWLQENFESLLVTLSNNL